MIDNILIIIILLSITVIFFTVKIWKKKNFVKELYFDEGVSITNFVITITGTIVLLTVYFFNSQGLSHSYLFLLMLLLYNSLLLFIYCLTATTCIYLKDNVLIKKNIFITKQILLNGETKIIEKFDIKIIKNRRKSISISSRYLTGKMNNLINNIKTNISN